MLLLVVSPPGQVYFRCVPQPPCHLQLLSLTCKLEQSGNVVHLQGDTYSAYVSHKMQVKLRHVAVCSSSQHSLCLLVQRQLLSLPNYELYATICSKLILQLDTQGTISLFWLNCLPHSLSCGPCHHFSLVTMSQHKLLPVARSCKKHELEGFADGTALCA